MEYFRNDSHYDRAVLDKACYCKGIKTLATSVIDNNSSAFFMKLLSIRITAAHYFLNHFILGHLSCFFLSAPFERSQVSPS